MKFPGRHAASRVGLIAAAMGIAMALGGSAEAHPLHLGIRGGVTDDPDSLFFGFHVSVGPRRDGFRLEPGVEFGAGSFRRLDYWTARGNLNVKYMVGVGRRRDQAIYPFLGAAFYHLESDPGPVSNLGINLGAGIEVEHFFFEFALGIGQIPDIAVTIGRHL